jgi:hypothetical protein
MFPDDPPVVLRRSRAWLLQLLAWRVVIALSALSRVGSTQDLSMPGPLRWTLVGVVALLAVRPSRDLSRTLSIDSIYLERGFSSWAWAYLTSVHLGPRESPRRIGRIEGLLRVRAGAEVPRRDADGCRRAVRQAGREAVQPSSGTRPLRPRSPQGRGRGLGLLDDTNALARHGAAGWTDVRGDG